VTAPITLAPPESLAMLLRGLKLPTVARHAEEVAQLAERDGWTFPRYLHHLVELEVHERRRRRIERHLKQSDLPADKTLATLTRARLPTKVLKALPALCEGGFVERGDNLLVFGLPGRGKTHLVCAIAHELILRGYRVLFIATFELVQRLLVAKRDLRLEQELATLDGTSNLVFSEWDRIFKDPMTTAAAIDRLVHHAVILEMTGTSIRVEHAHSERAAQGEPPTTTTPRTTTPTTTTSTTANPTIEGVKPATTTPTTNPATEGAKPATTTESPITPTPTKGVQTPTATRTPTRIKNREHSATEPDGEM
jgi:DNA replication protein DnaC